MRSKITTNGWILKSKSISCSQSKTRLKNYEKSKSWKTRQPSTNKTSRRPMTSVGAFKTNSTPSRTMFRKWSKCFWKPNSRAMFPWGNPMTKILNLTNRISGTTWQSSKSTFLTWSRSSPTRETIQMRLSRQCLWRNSLLRSLMPERCRLKHLLSRSPTQEMKHLG